MKEQEMLMDAKINRLTLKCRFFSYYHYTITRITRWRFFLFQSFRSWLRAELNWSCISLAPIIEFWMERRNGGVRAPAPPCTLDFWAHPCLRRRVCSWSQLMLRPRFESERKWHTKPLNSAPDSNLVDTPAVVVLPAPYFQLAYFHSKFLTAYKMSFDTFLS